MRLLFTIISFFIFVQFPKYTSEFEINYVKLLIKESSNVCPEEYTKLSKILKNKHSLSIESFLLPFACVESTYGKYHIGKSNEIGIFQISQYWVDKYAVNKTYLHNDLYNTCFAEHILNYLLEKYYNIKSLKHIISYYNTGENKKLNKKYIQKYNECKRKLKEGYKK